MRPGAPTAGAVERASVLAPAAVLSNGRYTTIVTGMGTGASFLEGSALTRWRADPVSDRDGFLVYLEDDPPGRVRTLGLRPAGAGASRYAAWWEPGAFVLERTDDTLDARLEICVSGHDPVEIRRLTLHNRGERPRRVGVTTYLEVVLEERLADLAHPAFSKLFVETSALPERGVLLARRRPRAGTARHPWLAHALCGEGPVELETDRARFLGRGGSLERPAAVVAGHPLSGTVGAVLDPVLCLRRWCRIEPGAMSVLILLLAADWERDEALAALARHAGPREAEAAFALAAMRARAQLEGHGLSEEAARKSQALRVERLYRGLDPRFATVLGKGDAILAEDEDGEARRVELGLAALDARRAPAGATGASADGAPSAVSAIPRDESAPDDTSSDNGFGHFAEDGTEYAIRLGRRPDGTLELPPAPWINLLANEEFGTLVSETGAGCTWSLNSREHRLTPWANDPVLDPHGEAFYLRDAESGAIWSILPGPAPAARAYEVRHGFGYTTVRHASAGIEHEILLFVPHSDPMQVVSLRLTNRGSGARQLQCAVYHALETGRPAEGEGAAGHWDGEAGLLLVRLPPRGDAPERTAFGALSVPGLRRAADWRVAAATHSFTCDSAAFLGAGGDLSRPASLSAGLLTGEEGPVASPCVAQLASFALGAGESVECLFLFGDAASADAARRLVEKYRDPARVEDAWQEVRRFWQETRSAVQVETPSAALDRAVNGWLLYQTLACRLWARTALYQSGGAFGFRDQIQDAMSLVFHAPERTRAQLLLHAAHEFEEGDVLHWWHPPLGRGLRTRFADDLLWLPFLTAQYVHVTGDEEVLGESVRYLSARALAPGEDEAFLLPADSGRRGDLYEHCCRALDRSLAVGSHGLPLFGTGDWNDGMNRVGREGRGESVWMAFFLHQVLGEFLPLCERRADTARARRYREHREALVRAIESQAWDGEWYRRGYYDDGTPLGSSRSDECRIDGLVQAWSVLSRAGSPERQRRAMQATRRHLVSERDGIIRLFWPPFDRTDHDPGYVKGYVPGVRENGGQYTHAALWMVRAFAELGDADLAARLLLMLLPENHARTADEVRRYRIEPYVVAADVYGVEPHVGRGGWSWYTGSAGWMLRVALESILGFRLLEGRTIELGPCVPEEWPGYRITYRVPGEATRYEFAVRREGAGSTVRRANLDGVAVPVEAGRARIPLARDGAVHAVEVILGDGGDGRPSKGRAIS